MLQKLIIENYAIIDSVEINFSSGLTVITGETGAGKSILMGALSLILGERADANVLRRKEKKCFIEGFFEVRERKNVIDFLKANDMEAENELVLRREIASNGKSRAFINDSPANLQQLKALASMLVDLHQQFDALELSELSFQLEVVDALAENENILAEYKAVYKEWKQSCDELQRLIIQKQDFEKEYSYNKFLLDEFSEANFAENELEDADKELKLLANAGDIKIALSKVNYVLKESEQPVLPLLKQLINNLHPFIKYHNGIETMIERITSTQIELSDIAEESERINDITQYDEARINYLNERLNLGYRLQKKHGVQSTMELLNIQKSLEEKLLFVLQIDEAIVAKEIAAANLLNHANQLAEDLSLFRNKIIQPFEKNVNALLKNVGMPNALLKVSITKCELNETGSDKIEFLFDANRSNKFSPIAKVASGGELSRLMLCIKSLVAEKINLPTLIFDEIDTGISGEAAKKTGSIMKELSTKRQVICITHQPQIAGRATAHLFVYKEIINEIVQTGIRVLDKEERIHTIAQMLSGEKPTAAALENAREIIYN